MNKNPMFDVRSMFPKASKSFLDANQSYGGVVTLKPNQNATTVNVEPRKCQSMTRPEREMAMILEAMKRKGEILRYEFEGITLRWFDMHYTPDFVVFRGSDLRSNGWTRNGIKLIEVKGAHIHYSQQAMARFKGARGFWPEFTFELHQLTKNGWTQIL